MYSSSGVWDAASLRVLDKKVVLDGQRQQFHLKMNVKGCPVLWLVYLCVVYVPDTVQYPVHLLLGGHTDT